MKILSFDTSGRSIHTCLLDDRAVAYQNVLEPDGGQRQESAAQLLPEIEAALNSCAWHKRDIDLVVVGAGPGSFTGVRIALVTARSLGQGLDLGVLPVCYLDVVAQELATSCALVLAAGAGQFFGAAYRQSAALPGSGAILHVAVDPFCAPLVELESRLVAHQPFVAEAAVQTLLSSGSIFAPWPEINNIATAGAFLAFDRLSLSEAAQNQTRDALRRKYPWQNATPLYLRNPSITLKSYGNSDKANDAC